MATSASAMRTGASGARACAPARTRAWTRALQPPPTPRRAVGACAKKGGNNAGDELLDFLQAKRKLRRWYGEGEREAMMQEMAERGEDEAEEEDELDGGDGDAVLLCGAETTIGEQVLLQLILARADVKLLVSDVTAAKTSYGDYVRPVSCDIGDASSMQKVLRGVGSVVVAGRVGALPRVLQKSGVAHVLLLSTAGTAGSGGGLLGGLFGGGDGGVLAEPAREAGIAKCGKPYTILRSGVPTQTRGGAAALSLVQADPAPRGGPISGEDLAKVAVAALMRPPRRGAYREVQVVSERGGAPPSGPAAWSQLFAGVEDAVLAAQG